MDKGVKSHAQLQTVVFKLELSLNIRFAVNTNRTSVLEAKLEKGLLTISMPLLVTIYFGFKALKTS